MEKHSKEKRNEMSDPYERVKGGRLTFKGGGVAVSSKSIDRKKKEKKNKMKNKTMNEDDIADEEVLERQQAEGESAGSGGGGEEVHTIDAAKRMKYEQLFPVEAKKFGYQKDAKSNFKSVEEALDDRVKKKADRYCK